ncbi:MAG TPA: glycoside hydrolase family 9 protein, partial [Candidatus Didemnitutus sp.]|nr:glycoside hydrolase family 9 protein [Candidatus Didemnitutus sp.]
GDVRLSSTPAQWDPVPQLIERKVNPADRSIEARMTYADLQFEFTIRAEARGDGVVLSVNLPQPLPESLVGRAGFNLEFLPAAYFHHTFLMDGTTGNFPLYPTGPMTRDATSTPQPQPLAIGRTFVAGPEDPTRRVTLSSATGDIALYDGRNIAQNGWFVARTLLPAGKSGRVVEWTLSASTVPNWTRVPVIGHSQAGYAPAMEKVAVIELDANDTPASAARVLRVSADGKFTEKFSAAPREWGRYLRYHYLTFDFSTVHEPGVYVLEYGGVRTAPFRIDADAYASAWHATLDVYLPVQMDHIFVNEAYRVWHGHSHRDDARQAPVNHEHFDLYAQGPTTDSPYQPGQHIPGLNVGGWLDAGDFDVRTQTQYAVVTSLVRTWETFAPKRDETTVDEKNYFVDIHVPDGVPDILQQIEHGALQLLAQHRAVGHAICGIIEPDLGQYTHLGDAASKTDGLIYNAEMKPGQADGFHSSVPDDRWAFTSKSSALNYGSAAGLAAASRALRGYRDALADECLATAKHVWDEEHSHAPDLFRHGNTTGGNLEDEEFRAAVELLSATREPRFAKRLDELWPAIEPRFIFNAAGAVQAMPLMSPAFTDKVKAATIAYRQQLDELAKQNPYGVPISTMGWAGNGLVVGFATTNYVLHKAFPDLIDSAAVLRGLTYLYGCHPGSDISFVSSVGTVSKEVAYGNNRADFTFIAGGVVPGALILKPDFPENKEDWPFLWGENEYVVSLGSSYIYLVHAANELLAEKR